MKRYDIFLKLAPVYVLTFILIFGLAAVIDRSVTAEYVSSSVQQRRCIIIDPGHGGIDGGAISCTGQLESNINLALSLRLNDLIHLLGYDTVMIRKTDISVYTEGESIAQKKVSDLKNRVRIANEVHNGILISIHQNNFAQSQYSGAQVFYTNTPGSDLLAKQLQSRIVQTINPGSNRKAKKSTGVYLMEHINCTGVLIECGFLSNPKEELLLQDPEYQENFASVIACELSTYLDQCAAN